MPDFKVVSEYEPAGDQPQAIEKLVKGLELGLNERRRALVAELRHIL